MTNTSKTLMGLCLAAATMGAFAQTPEDHQAHHPAGAASSVDQVKKAPVKAKGMDQMAAMDQRMKSMQAMHDKMMAAPTPEARQALMAEHMKTMQDGMAMMKQMGGKGMKGDMASRQQMMEKRMEMMESMMQMMMDRMPPAPAK